MAALYISPNAATPLRLVFESQPLFAGANNNILQALGVVIGPNAHIRISKIRLEEQSGAGIAILRFRLGSMVFDQAAVSGAVGNVKPFIDENVVDGAPGDDLGIDQTVAAGSPVFNGYIALNVLRP